MPTISQLIKNPVFALLAVGVASTFCTRLSNRAVADALSAEWIASACIPAVLVALSIYVLCRPRRPFALGNAGTSWARIFKISLGWLIVWIAGSVIYASVRGGWVPYVAGAPALVGFLLLGPLTEELLFRGAVFELAERVWPQNAVAPIVMSSILFSVYHLQLHAYQFNSFVALQLVFTLAFGFVLARLRHLSSSIWPGLVLHIATNLAHAFG